MAKKRSNESKNSANGQRKSRRIIGAPVASIAVEQPRIDVLNGKKGKEPHRTQVSLALTPSAAKKGPLPDDCFLETPPDTPQKEPEPGTPFELDDSSDDESKEMIGSKAGQSEVISIDTGKDVVPHQSCAVLKVQADLRKKEIDREMKLAHYKDNAAQREREREKERFELEKLKLNLAPQQPNNVPQSGSDVDMAEMEKRKNNLIGEDN